MAQSKALAERIRALKRVLKGLNDRLEAFELALKSGCLIKVDSFIKCASDRIHAKHSPLSDKEKEQSSTLNDLYVGLRSIIEEIEVHKDSDNFCSKPTASDGMHAK